MGCTFYAASCELLSFAQFFWEFSLEVVGDVEQGLKGLFGLLDELCLRDQRLTVFATQLLLDLCKSVLYKLFDNGLVADFTFQLLDDFPFSVGNDALHHLVLLLHFAILESFDFSKLLFLASESLFPLQSLLCNHFS